MISLFAHVGNLNTYIFLSFYFSVSHIYYLMVPLQKMKGGYAYVNEVQNWYKRLPTEQSQIKTNKIPQILKFLPFPLLLSLCSPPLAFFLWFSLLLLAAWLSGSTAHVWSFLRSKSSDHIWWFSSENSDSLNYRADCLLFFFFAVLRCCRCRCALIDSASAGFEFWVHSITVSGIKNKGWGAGLSLHFIVIHMLGLFCVLFILSLVMAGSWLYWV